MAALPSTKRQNMSEIKLQASSKLLSVAQQAILEKIRGIINKPPWLRLFI